MISHCNYMKPITLEEASILLKRENSELLAGGTDVIVHIRDNKKNPQWIIDLKGIDGLSEIREKEQTISIGALTKVQDIAESELLLPYTAIRSGAKSLGCFDIRNRATVGGNICNASPSADLIPGLLVYDAQLKIFDGENYRIENLEDFLLGFGKTTLKKGDIVTEILISKNTLGISKYIRRTRVKGMDLSGINIAMYFEKDAINKKSINDIKIALGAVYPQVRRVKNLESKLLGEINEDGLDNLLLELVNELTPRKDSLRATPEYKKQMIYSLLKKEIEELMEE